MFVDMMFPTWPVEVTRVLAENDKMHSFLPQKSMFNSLLCFTYDCPLT